MRVPAQPPPNPYLPAGLLRLTDAASHLRIWPVELAQAIREGRVAMVLGRAGELLIAQEEMERVRRKGSRGVEVRGARRTSPNEPR